MFIPSTYTNVLGQKRYQEISFLKNIYPTIFPPLLETLKEIAISATIGLSKKNVLGVQNLCL